MSLDYPNYEKMKIDSPKAAKLWRLADCLYYLGLLSAFPFIPTIAFAVYAWKQKMGIPFQFINFLLAWVIAVAVWIFAIWLKGKAYQQAEKDGLSFE